MGVRSICLDLKVKAEQHARLRVGLSNSPENRGDSSTRRTGLRSPPRRNRPRGLAETWSSAKGKDCSRRRRHGRDSLTICSLRFTFSVKALVGGGAGQGGAGHSCKRRPSPHLTTYTGTSGTWGGEGHTNQRRLPARRHLGCSQSKKSLGENS